MHNVANFLAAAACAAEIGVDPEEIVEAVAGATPAAGRGEIHRTRQATIVDDSYNSNPSALGRALTSAAELSAAPPAASRHWAVLGDMLELGDESEAFHRRAGGEAVARGYSLVIGVGAQSRALVDAVQEAGGEARWFTSADEAAVAAAEELQSGDVVLIKGSRGVGLEIVTRRLLAEEAPA